MPHYYTYSPSYTPDYTFRSINRYIADDESSESPAQPEEPSMPEPSSQAVQAKQRLDIVKEKILALDLSYDDLMFLNQGIINYVNGQYNFFGSQVSIQGNWLNWSGIKARKFLSDVGVPESIYNHQISSRGGASGYSVYWCLFSHIDGMRFGSIVVSMRMFIESLIGFPEQRGGLQFQEPVVCRGVSRWHRNYNPACECGHCNWARDARHGGGEVQTGFEFRAACDDELRELIRAEGKDCLSLMDEEDFRNPRIRRLYQENKFDEICELLEVV